MEKLKGPLVLLGVLAVLGLAAYGGMRRMDFKDRQSGATENTRACREMKPGVGIEELSAAFTKPEVTEKWEHGTRLIYPSRFGAAGLVQAYVDDSTGKVVELYCGGEAPVWEIR